MDSILKEKELLKNKQVKLPKQSFLRNILDNGTKKLFDLYGNWDSACFDRPKRHTVSNMPCHLRNDAWMARLMQFELLKNKKFVPYLAILNYVKNSDYFDKQRHEYELRIVKKQIEFMNECKDIYGRAFYFPDKDIFGKKKKGIITQSWKEWDTVKEISEEQWIKEINDPKISDVDKFNNYKCRHFFGITYFYKITHHTTKKSDPVRNWNWEAQECYHLHGIDIKDADLNFRNVVVNMLTMIGMDEEVVNEGLEKNSELWLDKYMEIAFDKETTFKVNENEDMISLGKLHKMWKDVRLFEYYQNHKEWVDKYGKVSDEMVMPKEEYITMKNIVDEQAQLRKDNKKIEKKSDFFSECLTD